jgi:uncharacterized protein YbjT (DUF2867 family)
MLQAVIFGATGLAGSSVLDECLKHPEVKRVTVVTRRSTGKNHNKLKEIIHQDFLDYSSIEDRLRGHNACFYCLGVSQTKVRNEDEYHEMTYDFTIAAAKTLTQINSELTFCFLSGAGTDPTMKSRFMWARIKGKAERDLESFPFKKLYIFRPGLIQPVSGKDHSLTITKITRPFYPVLYKLFPSFVTNTQEFGRAMITAALLAPSIEIFENRDIREKAKTGNTQKE